MASGISNLPPPSNTSHNNEVIKQTEENKKLENAIKETNAYVEGILKKNKAQCDLTELNAIIKEDSKNLDEDQKKIKDYIESHIDLSEVSRDKGETLQHDLQSGKTSCKHTLRENGVLTQYQMQLYTIVFQILSNIVKKHVEGMSTLTRNLPK